MGSSGYHFWKRSQILCGEFYVSPLLVSWCYLMIWYLKAMSHEGIHAGSCSNCTHADASFIDFDCSLSCLTIWWNILNSTFMYLSCKKSSSSRHWPYYNQQRSYIILHTHKPQLFWETPYFIFFHMSFSCHLFLVLLQIPLFLSSSSAREGRPKGWGSGRSFATMPEEK